MNKIRPLAIYLPQYHPIKENDSWWGKGFTEWTNVTKAKPLFKGHYQPHLPSELGFYDLRLHQIMIDQAKLAKEHGIFGFMFYHYWFSGKQLLEQPVNQWLENSEPNFPFCICWANENWSRRWDGQDNEILIRQNYSDLDDKLHFKELARHFVDERYIRIDDKPVFIVYRTNLFPDIKKTVKTWREEAIAFGFKGLYLISVNSLGNKINPKEIDFDAAMDFQPDFSCLPNRVFGSLKDKILHKLKIRPSPFVQNFIYNYDEIIENIKNRKTPNYKLYPSISPMWDNSARRKNYATIIKNSSPDLYKDWLQFISNNFKPYSAEENFIFINAWNEWAEGNHLEPCNKWGKAYLEATKEVILNG